MVRLQPREVDVEGAPPGAELPQPLDMVEELTFLARRPGRWSLL
jgi:hypothetical protein